MRGMNDVKEPVFAYLPKGRHELEVVVAEATESKKSGASMIHLEMASVENSEIHIHDYIITDGGAKGAWMGIQKLHAFGIDTSTDQEDEAICQQILGMHISADLKIEQAQDADGNKRTVYNEAGQEVPQYRNIIGQYVTVQAQPEAEEAASEAPAPAPAPAAKAPVKAAQAPKNGTAPASATPPWQTAKPAAKPVARK